MFVIVLSKERAENTFSAALIFSCDVLSELGISNLPADFYATLIASFALMERAMWKFILNLSPFPVCPEAQVFACPAPQDHDAVLI